jgi:amino acid permease
MKGFAFLSFCSLVMLVQIINEYNNNAFEQTWVNQHLYYTELGIGLTIAFALELEFNIFPFFQKRRKRSRYIKKVKKEKPIEAPIQLTTPVPIPDGAKKKPGPKGTDIPLKRFWTRSMVATVLFICIFIILAVIAGIFYHS